MKTIIYFIRHGEVYNPHKVLYGRLPGFPLTVKGEQQINKLAQNLVGKGISVIYTSPLERARQTADILAGHLGIAAISSNFLLETRHARDGISLVTFHAKVEPHLYEPGNLKAGQETIKSQAIRMQKFIKNIISKHLGQSIAAVSHGDPIIIVRAETEGKQLTYDYKKRNYIKPGECFTLEITGNNYRWHRCL